MEEEKEEEEKEEEEEGEGEKEEEEEEEEEELRRRRRTRARRRRRSRTTTRKTRRTTKGRRTRTRRTPGRIFFHDETRLKITFLQLTFGLHVTISKYECSWNDTRQPVFAVTPLFTRFYFNARLGRHFRYRSYGNCKGYDNTQT